MTATNYYFTSNFIIRLDEQPLKSCIRRNGIVPDNKRRSEYYILIICTYSTDRLCMNVIKPLV